MMFDYTTLTKDELQECKDLAVARVREQLADANNKMRRASYSYGGYEDVGARDIDKRHEDAFIGAIAELIGSKVAKCKWPKVMGQYKGNPEPDLSPKLKGQILKCDARGSRSYSSFLFRARDFTNQDGLLIAVTNLPGGPDCQVGHAFFRDIIQIANDHPEFVGGHRGAPYYSIPFKFLSGDFSEFGV